MAADRQGLLLCLGRLSRAVCRPLDAAEFVASPPDPGVVPGQGMLQDHLPRRPIHARLARVLGSPMFLKLPAAGSARLGAAMSARSIVAIVLVALCTATVACIPQSSTQHGPTATATSDSQQLAGLEAEVARLTARVAALEAENAALRHTDPPANALLPVATAPVAVAALGAAEDRADQPAVADPVVYVTPSGTKYHLPTCRYAATGTAAPLSAAARKREPCKVCHPPLAASADSARGATLAPSSSTPRATPSASSGGRCIATTQKGTRCKRSAKAGSAYCWQHG